MKNELKQERAITLIALVVTIIVLLILAGITINMLTSDNGIIKKALEAKQETEAAQEEENRILKEYEDLMKKYGSGSTGGEGTGGEGTGGDGTGGEDPGDEDEKLPETAEGQPADTAIKNPDSYGENPNAQATADGTGKSFAKPDGATYVEGTVDTGVVVNIKGSEFVWVPVDDVVLDTSRDANLPKSSSAGTSSGKTYTPMAVQVENDYKGILYEFSGSNGYLKYGRNTNYQGGGSSDYREPDVVSSYDGGSSDTVVGKITKAKLTTEYNAMIASILKYKGFYVARYEAGLDENKNIVFKDASVAGNKVTTTDASNSETSSWYGLYKKIKTFTTDSDKVVSSMIWGSQYDAMMNWMAKTGKEVGTAVDTKRNTTTITGGGEKPDIINNVYDLYGCHCEWTLEANSTSHRAWRGGYRDSNSPAYRSSNYPYHTFSSISSRATLYIK